MLDTYPLAGTRQSDPLNGGYSFGAWSTYSGSWHEGADFNSGVGGDADLGAEVYALWPGVVVADRWTPTGYGRSLWYLTDQLPDGTQVYIRYAHLNGVAVTVGQRVQRGDLMAWCGKSGGQTYAHTHTEVRNDRPPHWDYWNQGVPLATVQANYRDPVGFCQWLKANEILAQRKEDPDDMATLDDFQRDMLGLAATPGSEFERPGIPALGLNAKAVIDLVNVVPELWRQIGELSASMTAEQEKAAGLYAEYERQIAALRQEVTQVRQDNDGLRRQLDAVQQPKPVAVRVEGSISIKDAATGNVVATLGAVTE